MLDGRNSGYYSATRQFAPEETMTPVDAVQMDLPPKDPNALVTYDRKRIPLEQLEPRIVFAVNLSEGSFREREDLPRKRLILIGIGQKGLVITYPVDEPGKDRDHTDLEPLTRSALGHNVITFLSADIKPAGVAKPPATKKASHVITVFQTPEKEADSDPWHQKLSEAEGRHDPCRFLSERRAQSIMQALRADRLQVVYAQTSPRKYATPHMYSGGD
jgi:hypothetical protein